MMVRIQLMPLNFLGIKATDGSFRQFLADAGVDLTHLGSLADLVSCVLERLRCLHGPQACRRPYGQGPQRNIRATCLTGCLPLLLPVLQEGLGHPVGIGLASFAQAAVGSVRVLFTSSACANKEGGPGFDV